MAQVKDIFGTGITGTLNQVVFYQRNGKTFIRSRPVRHKTNDSPAQLLNKQRFSAMQAFARQFKFVIIPRIWDLASRTLTGRQLFMKTNKGAFDAQGNITDPQKVQLSTGKLTLPPGLAIQPLNDGSQRISVSWYPDSNGGKLAYWDELLVIGYGKGQYSDIKATAIRRGEKGGVFELPELQEPLTHLYLFFGSLDNRHYSESICMEL